MTPTPEDLQADAPKPAAMLDEASSLRALTAALQTQLAAAELRINGLKRDCHELQFTVRAVTDFQIGQMILLGVSDGQNVIWMQSLLNQYKRLLDAARQVVILGHSDGYYRRIIEDAVAAAKPEVFR